MATRKADDDVTDAIKRALHAEQVANGLLPADSPPDFVRPMGDGDGKLPWWFGPNYHPTPEALAEFGKTTYPEDVQHDSEL